MQKLYSILKNRFPDETTICFHDLCLVALSDYTLTFFPNNIGERRCYIEVDGGIEQVDKISFVYNTIDGILSIKY